MDLLHADLKQTNKQIDTVSHRKLLLKEEMMNINVRIVT